MFMHYWKPNISPSLEDKIKALQDKTFKENIVNTIIEITSLENPREKGGAYTKRFWAYPIKNYNKKFIVFEIIESENLINIKDITL